MINDTIPDLVVLDDDDLIIELITRIMEDKECRVHCFTSHDLCLAYLADASPTHLLVDMNMPKVDGLQFINILKDKNFNAGTKIYLCTGIPPEDEVLVQVNAMNVEVILKDNVCDRGWLHSTLGVES